MAVHCSVRAHRPACPRPHRRVPVDVLREDGLPHVAQRLGAHVLPEGEAARQQLQGPGAGAGKDEEEPDTYVSGQFWGKRLLDTSCSSPPTVLKLPGAWGGMSQCALATSRPHVPAHLVCEHAHRPDVALLVVRLQDQLRSHVGGRACAYTSGIRLPYTAL